MFLLSFYLIVKINLLQNKMFSQKGGLFDALLGNRLYWEKTSDEQLSVSTNVKCTIPFSMNPPLTTKKDDDFHEQPINMHI